MAAAKPRGRTHVSTFLPPDHVGQIEKILELQQQNKIRDMVIKHVPEYKDSDPALFELKHLTSALTNIVHKCHDPQSNYDVIFRTFGHIEFGDREVENNIFRILGEANVGPKFIVGNDEWRIESCIPGSDLNTQLFRDSSLLRTRAAQKLAEFHKVEACADFLSKDPWFYSTIKTEVGATELPESAPSKEVFLEELEFLAEAFKKEDSEITFCHNDYRPANLMRIDDDHLVVVDLETAGYNYRGFDLGRALNSINLNVTKEGCEWINGGFPEPEIEDSFLLDYLTAYLGTAPTSEETLKLKKETTIGYMAALMHLVVWSAGKSVEEDKIKWDYGKYSCERWEQYLKKKKDFEAMQN
jgi:thiamine kinase-like enzyme